MFSNIKQVFIIGTMTEDYSPWWSHNLKFTYGADLFFFLQLWWRTSPNRVATAIPSISCRALANKWSQWMKWGIERTKLLVLFWQHARNHRLVSFSLKVSVFPGEEMFPERRRCSHRACTQVFFLSVCVTHTSSHSLSWTSLLWVTQRLCLGCREVCSVLQLSLSRWAAHGGCPSHTLSTRAWRLVAHSWPPHNLSSLLCSPDREKYTST